MDQTIHPPDNDSDGEALCPDCAREICICGDAREEEE